MKKIDGKLINMNFLRMGVSVLICIFLLVPSVYAGASIRRQDVKSEISLINAKTTDIPVGSPVKTETRLLSSDKAGLYLVNTIAADDITSMVNPVEGDTYQKLVLPGYTSTSEVGKPQLPIKTVMVAIPTEGDVSLIIQDSQSIKKDKILVSPVPEQVERKTPEGYADLEDVFTLDQTSYTTNMFYPGTLVDFTYGFIRDQRILNLNFHPVQYNPVTQELQIHPLIQVQIKYSNPCNSVSKDVGPYSALCSQVLMNYNPPQGSSHDLASIPGPGVVSYPVDLANPLNSADYLIITSDVFYNPAQQDFNQGTQTNMLNRLAHWRSDYNGFDVAMVNVNNSFIGGNTDTNIKNFITYVYNNWRAPHMSDGHLGYILLVGDTPFVASHIYGGVADRWLVCIAGNDWLPEIMIGRFSVDDQNELDVIAEKTIHYEQNPEPGDWQHQALLCEGERYAARESWYHSSNNFPHYTFLKHTLLEQSGWTVTEAYQEEMGYSNANSIIKNAINDGMSLVIYCGHGYDAGWEYFSSYDFDQLHNGYKLPLVYSLACETGRFQNSDDCMGETFLNTPGKGAVAFWGYSISTTVDFHWCSEFLLESFMENHEYIVGKIINEGIFRLETQLPNTNVGRHANLLGDPALDLSGSQGRLKQEKPDLTLSTLDITLDPERLTTETTQVNITVKVHNIGGGNAENIPVRFLFENMNGEQYPIGDQVITNPVPAGGYSLVSQQWSIPSQSGGKKYVIVEIDPENVIDEAYELNNQAGKDAFVYSDTTYVDDDNILGPWEGTLEHPYRYIQDGIDTVNPGGTVRVLSGIYHENIEIYTPLNLQGDGQTITTIDGNGIIDVVYLSVDGYNNGANISGFTLRNATNTITVYHGVIRAAFSSKNNLIEENIIEDGGYGISLMYSTGNTVRRNIIRGNYDGLLCAGPLSGSGGNSIEDNIITSNTHDGINLSHFAGNIIRENLIINNSRGIYLSYQTQNNQIYHNTFLNNHQTNAFISLGSSGQYQWDNGYPSGGNYWSDFDQPCEGAWDNNTDGIIDRYYNIPGISGTSARDNYPLMHFFGAAAINLNTSQLFPTIQAAIDDPHTLSGHTIVVSPGIHQESILLNKQIQLQGVDPFNTILSGSQTSDVVTISADGAVLTGFTIRDCGSSFVGVRIQSDNGIVYNNRITQNTIGVLVEEHAVNTKIYHNDFINNSINAYDWGVNSWDDGYPSAGNYWSTYTGVDQYHGPGQNITGPDYIGDTPYNVSGKIPPNQDRYPLMNPWVISLDSPAKPNHVNVLNNYPNEMNKGIGRIRWSVPGGVLQTFSTTSRNNNVYYKFYFGDDTDSGWVGPYSSGQVATVTHDFNNVGFFNVYVVAKVGTQLSHPSDTLTVQMFKLGDVNGDGRVTFADIDPFVVALNVWKWGKDSYYAMYPSSYWYTADTNLNNDVTFADIDPFVALIGN